MTAKPFKGFSSVVKGRIDALFDIHGSSWTAILNDLVEQKQRGEVAEDEHIPSDWRTIKSYIARRPKPAKIANDLSLSHDIRIFKESDRVLAEEEMREFLYDLEKYCSFDSRLFDRVELYIDNFIASYNLLGPREYWENMRFVDREIRVTFERMLGYLHLVFDFCQDDGKWEEEIIPSFKIYRLTPDLTRYMPRSKSEYPAIYESLKTEISGLAKRTHEAYLEYRSLVTNRLGQ